MVLSVDNAAALIPGAPLPVTHRRVRVTRPFMYQGQVQAVDAEITVPALLAAELSSANKAQVLLQATGDAVAASPAAAGTGSKPRAEK